MSNEKRSLQVYKAGAKRHELFLATHFLNRQQEFANPDEIMDWPADSKETRFQPLLGRLVELKGGFSILDIGCGDCFLYNFINRSLNRDFHYHGIDVIDIYDHRLDTFGNFNYTNISALACLEGSRTFDVVYLSGIFNEKSVDVKDFSYYAISQAFAKCRKFICYNKFTNFVDYTAKNIEYYNLEEEVQFIVDQLSPSFAIDHRNYGLYDSTFTVYKS